MLPLRTDRLVIRMMRAADAARLISYRNDPQISRFQDWELPFTDAAAARIIDGQQALAGPVDGQWVQLAVDLQGKLVGDVAVQLRSGGTQATLGYTLAPEHQGHGYATEAVAAVVDALCAQGVHRFVASLDPANVASMRVLEAVGFTFECLAQQAELVRGEWVDDLRYSLLATDRSAWALRPRTPPQSVELVEITPDDAYLWGRLATHHSQQRFVATMPLTFRDALFPEVVDGAPAVPWMRGVLADGERAAFTMLAEQTEHHPEPYLWRLLVDRRHQRRGIGERVVRMLADQLRAQGHTSLLSSYEQGHGTPAPFYARLGFQPTGRLVDGEVEIRLPL